MPFLLLEGETPRLIDEWQNVPELRNAVRHSVDQRRKQGQFILTGSAMPNDELTAHSGIGRISRIQMRPYDTLRVERKHRHCFTQSSF